MKKSIAAVIISLFCLLVLMVFSGCVRVVPYDNMESLQKLKNSIDSDLNIIFPDTTIYKFAEDAQYLKVYKGKSNLVQGYNFGGDLDAAHSDTLLWNLNFTCRIIETTYDERNPAPPINANTKILGVDVYEQILDESDDPDLHDLGWYPEESKIVHYSYQFDLKGCRYSVSGTM